MFFKPKIDLSLFIGICVNFAIKAPLCDPIISINSEMLNNRKLLHEQGLFKNVPGDIWDKLSKLDPAELITQEEKERFDSEVSYFRIFVLNLELIKLNQSLNLGYSTKEIAMCLTAALEVVCEKMGIDEVTKIKTEDLYKKSEVFSAKLAVKLEKTTQNNLIFEKFGEGYYLEEVFSEIVSPNAWDYGTEETVGLKSMFINQLSTLVYYNIKDFCNALSKENKILKKKDSFISIPGEDIK